MKTKIITAHVPLPLAAWIDQEERHRLTLEAMIDVDNHNVIDHQSVQAWAKSLSTESPLSVPR